MGVNALANMRQGMVPTRKTYRTDKAHVYDLFVAKACGAKVNLILRWNRH